MQEFTCGRIRLKIVELNFLRCSGRRSALCVEEFWMPVKSEEVREDLCTGLGRKAFELCNLVLTTSNGHVTTAPAVPATLKSANKGIVMNFIRKKRLLG